MTAHRLGIIGSKSIIQSFKLFGIEIFPIDSEEEGRAAIKKIMQEEFAVIFITEDWMEKLDEDLTKLKQKTIPAVISLPTHLSDSNYGIKELKKTVERAVGSDILFKDKK
jgi:V/A-type H+/Na+-transporting ATPase subunit F